MTKEGKKKGKDNIGSLLAARRPERGGEEKKRIIIKIYISGKGAKLLFALQRGGGGRRGPLFHRLGKKGKKGVHFSHKNHFVLKTGRKRGKKKRRQMGAS